MKSLFKYIGLLFIIALSVCVVAVGAMFISAKLFPKNAIKLFGYSYFEFTDKGKHSILHTNSEFHTIEFNVNHMSVEVTCMDDYGYMHLTNNNRMWGVAKVEEGVEYGESYEIVDGVLKISVTEPQGLMLNTQASYLHLELTKDYASKNIIVNGKNATINIGGSNGLLKVNNLEFNVNNSAIYINELYSALNNVTVKSNNNKLNTEQNINGELNIETKTSTFTVANINNVEANATNLQLNANKVNSCNFTSASGIIKFAECGNININGNVRTTINYLTGNYSETNRTNANLKITTATGNVQAKSTSGEVEIASVSGGLDVTTTVGNVTVTNALCGVNITTQSGTCKVTFGNSVPSDAEFNFKSKNGSITANNIKIKTTVNIEDNGVCVVNLNFTNIVGENVINAKKGNVTVTAPIKACVVNVTSSGTKDISYADVVSKDNLLNQYVSGATEGTQEKLTITATSGKITLKSQSE